MKKLLRHWWVLVIGLVVLLPVAALSAVPHGGTWTTVWFWHREFCLGRADGTAHDGSVKFCWLSLGFLSAFSFER